MENAPEKLNNLLEIVQEFGPNRAIPVRERVRARYPHLAESEMEELLTKCRDIEAKACDLASQVLEGKESPVQLKQQLHILFPELTPFSLSRTVSQALYFASK